MVAETQMLNRIHINHLYNTDGGGQAMGEELRYVVNNNKGTNR